MFAALQTVFVYIHACQEPMRTEGLNTHRQPTHSYKNDILLCVCKVYTLYIYTMYSSTLYIGIAHCFPIPPCLNEIPILTFIFVVEVLHGHCNYNVVSIVISVFQELM